MGPQPEFKLQSHQTLSRASCLQCCFLQLTLHPVGHGPQAKVQFLSLALQARLLGQGDPTPAGSSSPVPPSTQHCQDSSCLQCPLSQALLVLPMPQCQLWKPPGCTPTPHPTPAELPVFKFLSTPSAFSFFLRYEVLHLLITSPTPSCPSQM